MFEFIYQTLVAWVSVNVRSKEKGSLHYCANFVITSWH